MIAEGNSKAVCRTVILVVLPAILLAVGCFPDMGPGTLAGVEDGGDSAASDTKQRVSLATFNVENFDLGGEAEGQYNAVAAFAASFTLDLLVLQEIQNDGGGDDEALFSLALDDAGYDMPHHAVSSMSDGFNAMGIWSRFPLLEVSEVVSENTRSVFRISVGINNITLTILACHLKAGSDTESVERRMTEAGRVESYIVSSEHPADSLLVLLGDMNTSVDADWAPGGTLARLSLLSNNPEITADDLWPANFSTIETVSTFPASGEIFDHILLSTTARDRWVPGSVSVPSLDGSGPYGPSDHRPVLIHLNL